MHIWHVSRLRLDSTRKAKLLQGASLRTNQFCIQVVRISLRGFVTMTSNIIGASSISSSSASPQESCDGGTKDEPAIYFACRRDWCDHVFLHPSGKFANATVGGVGRWSLKQPQGAGGILLELTSDHDHAKDVFIADNGDVDLFVAGTSVMRHVQGPRLLLGDLSPKSRRSLVFSSVGNQCLPVVRDSWLSRHEIAGFDLAMVFYKDVGSEVYNDLLQLAAKHSSFVELHMHKGMKWPNFKHWAQLQGGYAALAARYDYIWIVDDDVRLSTEGINKLFSLLREHSEVDIASPSFDAASEGVWRYFDGHNPECILRYTDFVECTAPVIKTSLFLDPVFCKAIRAARTGCFLDFCFHATVGGARDALAIIDAVQCHHPPRDEDMPSEMRAVQPWEDHRQDDVHFENEGLPKDWWWYRRPQVYSCLRRDDAISTSVNAAPDAAATVLNPPAETISSKSGGYAGKDPEATCT